MGASFLWGLEPVVALVFWKLLNVPPPFQRLHLWFKPLWREDGPLFFGPKKGPKTTDQKPDALSEKKVRKGDVVVGIAASGVTAFVQQGLRAAKEMKANTILVTCSDKVHPSLTDVVIAVKTGPAV
ncbi:hypothetical protein BVX98_07770, partial [bacterium F11]